MLLVVGACGGGGGGEPVAAAAFTDLSALRVLASEASPPQAAGAPYRAFFETPFLAYSAAHYTRAGAAAAALGGDAALRALDALAAREAALARLLPATSAAPLALALEANAIAPHAAPLLRGVPSLLAAERAAAAAGGGEALARARADIERACAVLSRGVGAGRRFAAALKTGVAEELEEIWRRRLTPSGASADVGAGAGAAAAGPDRKSVV